MADQKSRFLRVTPEVRHLIYNLLNDEDICALRCTCVFLSQIRPRSRLLCLSPELICLICEVLEPKDVRALRCTCRVLSEIGAPYILPTINIEVNSKSMDILEFYLKRPSILTGLRNICVRFSPAFVDLDFAQYTQAMNQLARVPHDFDKNKESLFKQYKEAFIEQEALLSGRFAAVVTAAIQNTPRIDHVSFTTVYERPSIKYDPRAGDRNESGRCVRLAFETVVKIVQKTERVSIRVSEQLDLDWSSIAGLGMKHLSLRVGTVPLAPLFNVAKQITGLKSLQINTVESFIFPEDGPRDLEKLRLQGLRIHEESLLSFLRCQNLTNMSIEDCSVVGYWADLVSEIRSAVGSRCFRDIALQKLTEIDGDQDRTLDDKETADLERILLGGREE